MLAAPKPCCMENMTESSECTRSANTRGPELELKYAAAQRVRMKSRRPLSSRVRLYDRVYRLQFRLAYSKSIDGLWVGCIPKHKKEALPRVEAALGLIKTHDPVRYGHLIRDLEHVWVTLVPGGRAQYIHALRLCEIDERFVLAETTGPESIASTIVHEATH